MLSRVIPGVVNISTTSRVRVRLHPLLADPIFRQLFQIPDIPAEQKRQSLGSGVIVDAGRGYVLTNRHVVADADRVDVTLADGRRFQAAVVGTDRDSDIALIRIPADRLEEVRWGTSAALEVGDFIVAIGNPFGLGQTVTSGIVSALGRQVSDGQGRPKDFIQTDASVNPGSSGGALVNLRGELVGINTAIVGASGVNVGISFAIPSDRARAVMARWVGR
jgi:serine protease Do/serine protease DegQ